LDDLAVLALVVVVAGSLLAVVLAGALGEALLVLGLVVLGARRALGRTGRCAGGGLGLGGPAPGLLRRGGGTLVVGPMGDLRRLRRSLSRGGRRRPRLSASGGGLLRLGLRLRHPYLFRQF